MISRHRPSPQGSAKSAVSAPALQEETLKTERIQIERKSFVFSLKENPRGRFLRITEDAGGHRDSIIVPAPGLEDFKRTVAEMAQASAETPPQSARSEHD